MNAADYRTGWEHPLTRRSWAKHMAMNVVGLLCWPVAWIGQLYALVVFLSPGYALLLGPSLCYTLYRTVVQLSYFSTAFRMRCILREYPWQVSYKVPRGVDEHPDAEDDGIWIELPDPTDPSRHGVPLTFVKHHRSYWWLRHIGGPRTKPTRKAKLEPLWFAGDPRFLGVVAVSTKDGLAPRRLHFLYRPSAFAGKAAHQQWDNARPAELERARRAGARFLDVGPASH